MNSATDSALALLIRQVLGVDDAEPMLSTLRDWQDADAESRANGAEAAWYRAVHRPMPTNASIADTAELYRIRGWENAGSVVAELSTDGGRPCLLTATRAVLRTVPGMSAEAVEALLVRRASPIPMANILAIQPLLSPPAADSLLRAYTAITEATTMEPDAWTVMAEARAGWPRMTVRLGIRLQRQDRRVVELDRSIQ